MTFENVNSIISEIATALKCDYAYSSFKDGKARNPFLVFYYSGSDDVYADCINYANIEALNIEFYSSNKEIESEQTIRQILASHDISFDTNCVWVDSEKVFLTTFMTEVVINEQQNQI